MIRLVKTGRKPNFKGATPAVLACATLFVFSVLAVYGTNQHLGSNITLCPFKLVTGQPCFLCGGTRASISLATGDPFAAVRYNPLVTAILVYAGLVLILKFGFARKFEWGGRFQNRQWLWIVAIGVVAANWFYVWWRL